MKMVTKRLSIGLLAVALGSAGIGAAGPAMARGGHGGGHHGGGWGHHGGGWGHGWGHHWGYGFGYGGYAQPMTMVDATQSTPADTMVTSSSRRSATKVPAMGGGCGSPSGGPHFLGGLCPTPRGGPSWVPASGFRAGWSRKDNSSGYGEAVLRVPDPR